MLYLASQSPRRRQLLEQLKIPYTSLVLEVDENLQNGESPQDYVRRLALEKARAGFAALREREGAWVLGSDTSVVLAGQVFGKPENATHAADMLHALAGREHQVMSAVALCGAWERVELNISTVHFRALSEAEIQAYIAGGEPFGKAGAYAIQGAAAAFIPRLEGSYSGVMGLPLFETMQLLEAARVL